MNKQQVVMQRPQTICFIVFSYELRVLTIRAKVPLESIAMPTGVSKVALNPGPSLFPGFPGMPASVDTLAPEA